MHLQGSEVTDVHRPALRGRIVGVETDERSVRVSWWGRKGESHGLETIPVDQAGIWIRVPLADVARLATSDEG